MANHLVDALSPYLRQHAQNPVDWWQWGPEAFAEARRRDVPVLLSVGYAACHWCHVMAHESFEDPRTAAVMNEGYVNIKVDREERPDIDAVYMAATQALTGRGGWPMTVFLDHEGQAFLAGTYFPPVAHAGLPSFTEVLDGVLRAWRTDRGRIDAAAQEVLAALDRGQARVPTGGRLPELTDLTRAVDTLAGQFDASDGGFGGAPKFPPSMVLEFLLRADALTRAAGAPDERALAMAEQTMRAMAGGGMYDQLAGGFARYSVDAHWTVPHFEKMLYDNALLLRAYLHWYRATGDRLARRVVEETAQFLLRDLATPQGAFASSLDADSEGREGAAYVWTPRQLREVLGSEDGDWVADLCGVTAGGSFERGASVLQLRREPDDPQRWAICRDALLAARAAREQPARDDKVVAAWNGLAIAALAEASALCDEPSWGAAAQRCAEWLADHHWDHDTGALARISLGTTVSEQAPGTLEDYADLAEGLLTLFQVTGQRRWLTTAERLADVVLQRFADGGGGFYDTAEDAPALVRRPRELSDGVTPSGTSAAANVLLTLGALTGQAGYLRAADDVLARLVPLSAMAPRFAGWSLSVAAARLSGPVQVAIVLPAAAETGGAAAADELGSQLHRTALGATSPGLVVAIGTESQAADGLLAHRPAIDNLPTAYPCREFVCQRPVTHAADLARLLAESAQAPPEAGGHRPSD